ncbi:MAG: hypothetical protein Q9160_007232 [Pyrenula sp. 1 TL-2023]
MGIDSVQDVPRKRQRQENSRHIGRGDSYRPGGHVDVDRGNSDNLRDDRSREDQEYLLDYGITHHYGKGESYRPTTLPSSRFGPTDRNDDNGYEMNRISDHRHRRDSRYEEPLRSRENRPREHNRPPPPYSKGKRKKKPPKSEASAKHSSLRAKIRSLEKLLSHAQDTMPADVRQDKERELEALNIDLRMQEEKTERAHIIGRYHFVRFLERKRAQSKLKQLRKQQMALETNLQNTIDENTIENIQRTLQPLKELYDETKVDLNYIIYAPLGEKYISLYPKDNARTNTGPSKPVNDSASNEKTPDRDSDKQSLKKASPPKPNDFNHSDQLTQDLKAGILPSATGEKPPLWYTIQDYTLLGDAGIPSLETLRDRSGKGHKAIAHTDGGANLSAREGEGGKHNESVPTRGKRGRGDRMNVDGMEDEDGDGDGDEDSDGGFFESMSVRGVF